ncbi:MAG: EAL domain-containing protein [Burkholderiales bacterium]|nr:MAG: EAL domain-containing protein [Burkholderiales bacterium]
MRQDIEAAFSALEGESSSGARPRLIAVDDDPTILDVIEVVGNEAGYDVLLLSDPGELLAALERFRPQVIISDLMMPNMDGVTLLRNLGAAGARCSVIVASAADPKTLTAAVRLGGGYGLDMAPPMHKPFTATILHEALTRSRGAIPAAELRQALTNGELEVWYQPKVSLRPNDRDKTVGAEALVRWRHPERGILPAERFIGLIESEGMIASLSSFVLAHVIHDLGQWSGLPSKFAVGVNLPASIVCEINFPDQLADMLAKAGVAPSNVMIEVTEREAIADHTVAIDSMTRLRLKGVGLSMDDFGLGHSSLAELYRMPFSEVKIDASFIRDLTLFPDARKIIKSVIDLSRELGIECCAEGIETQLQAIALKALGCSKGQGHLFGRAIPPQHFEALLGVDTGAVDQNAQQRDSLAGAYRGS